MKFVLVFLALVAIAVAAPSGSSSGTLDLDKLHGALVKADTNPVEAHGLIDLIKGVGSFVYNKVLPIVDKIIPITERPFMYPVGK